MSLQTFIPTLWSARLLYAMEKTHVATNLVNRDYEGEIKNVGDKVKINTLGKINVNNYVKGTPITLQDLATTDDTLTIDQAKYFAFKVENIDKAQTAGDVVDKAMSEAAYELVDASDAFILGKIAAAGISNANVIGSQSDPIVLSASNVYQYIVALRTALDKANVPKENRSVVVPPEIYSLLLLDQRFTSANATAEDVIVNGYVGNCAGFKVYESNNVVSSDGVFQVTAQIPNATTYAEQILNTEAFRPEGGFQDAVKGLNAYGCLVTNKNGIVAMYAKV